MIASPLWCVARSASGTLKTLPLAEALERNQVFLVKSGPHSPLIIGHVSDREEDMRAVEAMLRPPRGRQGVRS